MPPSSVSDNNDESCDGAITEIQVVNAFAPNVSLDDVKVTVDSTKIADSLPMLDARRPSESTTEEQVSDGASMATIHVTEPSLPAPDRPGPGLTPSTTRSPPSSPTRSSVLHEEPYTTPHQRGARHRSAIEVRRSAALCLFITYFFLSHAPRIVSPAFSRILFTVGTLHRRLLASLFMMMLLVLKMQVLTQEKSPDPLHHLLPLLPHPLPPFLLRLSKSLDLVFQRLQPISVLHISHPRLLVAPFSPLTIYFCAIPKVSTYCHFYRLLQSNLTHL